MAGKNWDEIFIYWLSHKNADIKHISQTYDVSESTLGKRMEEWSRAVRILARLFNPATKNLNSAKHTRQPNIESINTLINLATQYIQSITDPNSAIEINAHIKTLQTINQIISKIIEEASKIEPKQSSAQIEDLISSIKGDDE